MSEVQIEVRTVGLIDLEQALHVVRDRRIDSLPLKTWSLLKHNE